MPSNLKQAPSLQAEYTAVADGQAPVRLFYRNTMRMDEIMIAE